MILNLLSGQKAAQFRTLVHILRHRTINCAAAFESNVGVRMGQL